MSQVMEVNINQVCPLCIDGEPACYDCWEKVQDEVDKEYALMYPYSYKCMVCNEPCDDNVEGYPECENTHKIHYGCYLQCNSDRCNMCNKKKIITNQGKSKQAFLDCKKFYQAMLSYDYTKQHEIQLNILYKMFSDINKQQYTLLKLVYDFLLQKFITILCTVMLNNEIEIKINKRYFDNLFNKELYYKDPEVFFSHYLMRMNDYLYDNSTMVYLPFSKSNFKLSWIYDDFYIITLIPFIHKCLDKQIAEMNNDLNDLQIQGNYDYNSIKKMQDTYIQDIKDLIKVANDVIEKQEYLYTYNLE